MRGRCCAFAGQSSRVQQCENTTEHYSSKAEWEVFNAVPSMLECTVTAIMYSIPTVNVIFFCILSGNGTPHVPL
jgi:hypothetical protein